MRQFWTFKRRVPKGPVTPAAKADPEPEPQDEAPSSPQPAKREPCQFCGSTKEFVVEVREYVGNRVARYLVCPPCADKRSTLWGPQQGRRPNRAARREDQQWQRRYNHHRERWTLTAQPKAARVRAQHQPHDTREQRRKKVA